MSLHPAYDALFGKHKIRFHTSVREWKDDCPKCGGKNSLSVHYDDDAAEWRCGNCGWNGSERLRPARAKPDGNGARRADDDDDLQRVVEEIRREVFPDDDVLDHIAAQIDEREQNELTAHSFDIEIEQEPAPESQADNISLKTEPAGDGSSSHIWRSKDYDYPCTPTGQEQPASDGRIYAWVKTPDGGQSCVPKDELITKADAAVEPKPIAEPSQLPMHVVSVLPDLAIGVEYALRNNPEGPFSEELLEKFERLAREQLAAFARLCRRYPALGEAARLDAATVRTAIENAGKDEVVALFIDLAMVTDLDPIETDTLARLVAEKSGVKLRPLQAKLKQVLKEAQKQRAAWRAKAARAKRLAARKDPRPPIDVPAYNAPWLPIADEVKVVLGHVTAAAPPERDIDGVATRGRKLAVPKMHAFSQIQANPETEE